jgi:flagellar basal-body rod protein FlgC
MESGSLFRAFDVSANGLTAQRARLNAISANIANAQTTRTPEGGPYRRRLARMSATGSRPSNLFERMLDAERSVALEMRQTAGRHLSGAPRLSLRREPEGVAVDVQTDEQTPTRTEYEPGHPDANEEGYVEYPNVEIIREMVDLMSASRAYEANVTVLNATKAMLRKALEI